MDAGDEGARRGSAAAHAAAARARRKSGIGVGDLTMPAFSALATQGMTGVALLVRTYILAGPPT